MCFAFQPKVRTNANSSLVLQAGKSVAEPIRDRGRSQSQWDCKVQGCCAATCPVSPHREQTRRSSFHGMILFMCFFLSIFCSDVSLHKV